MIRPGIAVLCVWIAVFPACSLLRRSHTHVSMPTRVFVPPPPPAPRVLPPPSLGDPPALDPEPPPSELALDIPTPTLPPRPPRPRVRRPRPEPAAKEEREEKEEEGEEEVASDSAAQLVELLSPEKRREYDALIDQDLAQAKRSLGTLAGRSLNTEQTESSKAIQIFILQAQQAREQDPVRALSLAERASVLAQHLEKTFK